MRAVHMLRDHAKEHGGFIDARDSLLPAGEFVDLVTVYTFTTKGELEDWERDPRRNGLLAQVDSLCVDVSERAAFDGISLLTADRIKVSRHETVVVLVVLILLLGALVDIALPPMAEPWRTVVAVTVNVCLVSYLFLPWSLQLLVWLKDRLRS